MPLPPCGFRVYAQTQLADTFEAQPLLIANLRKLGITGDPRVGNTKWFKQGIAGVPKIPRRMTAGRAIRTEQNEGSIESIMLLCGIRSIVERLENGWALVRKETLNILEENIVTS